MFFAQFCAYLHLATAIELARVGSLDMLHIMGLNQELAEVREGTSDEMLGIVVTQSAIKAIRMGVNQ